ncbi:universal stress protein [Lactococcus garvieae]|jgi:nucleotide-binding universal stress UspA family protein|uniref:Universal stress protein n=1 Tax=Lactococcus garvieae DCC43 TaxID=1231377 RepID=K2PLK5_9LACT|nr:universal stress protein [Lactococcus garvieae]EKF51084.1 Universal stress protein family [Lactococcus garvieae DCC43]QPS71901.1 universal stress protein [Lactococcus garvieae]
MREKYQNILVAVDGSEQSDKAVLEAVKIAMRNETSLFVLNVKDDVRLYGSAYGIPLILENLEEQSRAIIERATELIKKQVEFKSFRVEGSPKKEIIDFAEEHDIDLIVIGVTGKGAFDRLLVGSTTAYVIDHARCNVMVVK